MPEPQEHAAENESPANENTNFDPVAALEEAEAALKEAEAAFEVERAEMRDRLMRALADLENSRKRAEKDRRDAALYGGSKLARDLLPVYDNLNRALSLADEQTRNQSQGLVEGLELTLRELTNIFAKHGIEKISPKIGDVFDPHLHEAMFEAPIPDTNAGQIIQLLTDGFTLHGQLLRPAQVGVSSSPAK